MWSVYFFTIFSIKIYQHSFRKWFILSRWNLIHKLHGWGLSSVKASPASDVARLTVRSRSLGCTTHSHLNLVVGYSAWPLIFQWPARGVLLEEAPSVRVTYTVIRYEPELVPFFCFLIWKNLLCGVNYPYHLKSCFIYFILRNIY